MGVNPIPAIIWCLAFGAWTGYLLYGDAGQNVSQLPECNGFGDIITGCNDLRSELFALVVVGTVPGLPWEWNFVFGFIGVIARLQIGWALLEWLRGN